MTEHAFAFLIVFARLVCRGVSGNVGHAALTNPFYEQIPYHVETPTIPDGTATADEESNAAACRQNFLGPAFVLGLAVLRGITIIARRCGTSYSGNLFPATITRPEPTRPFSVYRAADLKVRSIGTPSTIRPLVYLLDALNCHPRSFGVWQILFLSNPAVRLQDRLALRRRGRR